MSSKSRNTVLALDNWLDNIINELFKDVGQILEDAKSTDEYDTILITLSLPLLVANSFDTKSKESIVFTIVAK